MVGIGEAVESVEMMKIEEIEKKRCRKLQGRFRDQGFGRPRMAGTKVLSYSWLKCLKTNPGPSRWKQVLCFWSRHFPSWQQLRQWPLGNWNKYAAIYQENTVGQGISIKISSQTWPTNICCVNSVRRFLAFRVSSVSGYGNSPTPTIFPAFRNHTNLCVCNLLVQKI